MSADRVDQAAPQTLSALPACNEKKSHKPDAVFRVVLNDIDDGHDVFVCAQNAIDKLVLVAFSRRKLCDRVLKLRRAGRCALDDLKIVRVGFKQLLHRGFMLGQSRADEIAVQLHKKALCFVAASNRFSLTAESRG